MPGNYQSDFQIFTEGQITALREGGKILRGCLEMVASMVRPGVTLLELDSMADLFIRDHSAEPGFKGYNGFPFSLCTSVNDACVHGIPSDMRLAEGDIIALDCGVLFGGLYTDACVTVPVGRVSDRSKKLLCATKTALDCGLDMVRSGVHIGDISHAIHSRLLDRGFDAVRQLTGHGLGDTLHQFPNIPNFGRAGCGPSLPKNTIIAIEPISTAGSTEIREDPDGWTLRTKDGALSAHFEHTVLVTGGGCEILT